MGVPENTPPSMAETHKPLDCTTTIADLKEAGRAFADARGWHRGDVIKDLAMCIAAEAGELLQALRFRKPSECERLLREDRQFCEEVEDEVADVFIFLLRLCQRYNFDIATIVTRKIMKNGQKYPLPEGPVQEGPAKLPDFGWYE